MSASVVPALSLSTIAVALACRRVAISWSRQRAYLPEDARPEFDKHFSIVLRRAIACAVE